MSKKRTLQNNLSYALRYMFDNYGMNIFLDSQKFLVTLDNLIPTLEEELKLVKFAVEKNAISTLLNAHNQREVDKNFAYLRAKTILTKNGVAEKGALYIIDCFLYALDWVDDFPDYEDLSDEDFKISEVTSEEAKNKALAKKLSAQNSNNNIKDKPSIQLNKKTTSENAKKEDKKVEPIHFEEKSLSSIKRETKENKNLKQDEDKNNNLHNEKIEQKTNSKYYLNHNFDNEDESDYDDDYEDDYKSGSIFKKIALILVPVIILGCIAFFMFRNMAKEAEPIVSGVSITTEYQIDNGVYVLPINKETDLNVIVQSNNSKELDLSKLSFKIDDDSICTLENDGKKCTITGLKEGKTNLVVIYNNEIIDTISLSFKEFTKDSNSDKDKTSDKVENNNKAEDKQQEENNKNNNSTNNSNTGSGTSTGGNNTGGGTGTGGNTGGGTGTGGNTGGGTGTGGNTGGGTGTGGNTGGGTGTGGNTGGGTGTGGNTGGGTGTGGNTGGGTETGGNTGGGTGTGGNTGGGTGTGGETTE